MMHSSGVVLPFKTPITLCETEYLSLLWIVKLALRLSGIALKSLLRAMALISPVIPALANSFLADSSVIQPSTLQRSMCLLLCCKYSLAPVLLLLTTCHG